MGMLADRITLHLACGTVLPPVHVVVLTGATSCLSFIKIPSTPALQVRKLHSKAGSRGRR